jgi:hypothetical protein
MASSPLTGTCAPYRYRYQSQNQSINQPRQTARVAFMHAVNGRVLWVMFLAHYCL